MATVTTQEPQGLIRLRHARCLIDADLPEEYEGHRTPRLERLRWLLRHERDLAVDGCSLETQGTLCEHGEPSWLTVLDLL